MKPWRISRRTTLKGLGVSLSLPLLEVMTPLSAKEKRNSKPPLRMGFFYLPNGCPSQEWQPTQEMGDAASKRSGWASIDVLNTNPCTEVSLAVMLIQWTVSSSIN